MSPQLQLLIFGVVLALAFAWAWRRIVRFIWALAETTPGTDEEDELPTDAAPIHLESK